MINKTPEMEAICNILIMIKQQNEAIGLIVDTFKDMSCRDLILMRLHSVAETNNLLQKIIREKYKL